MVNLCDRSILLDKGVLLKYDNTEDVILSYNNINQLTKNNSTDLLNFERFGTGKALFTSVRIFSANDIAAIQSGEDINISLKIKAISKIEESNVAIIISDFMSNRIIDVNTAIKGDFINLNKDESILIEFKLKNVLLKPGTYNLGLWLGRSNIEETDSIISAAYFTIEDQYASKHTEIFPGTYQCAFQHKILRDFNNQ